MLEVEICVDVPDLDEGLRFYGEAFGFAPVLQPYPCLLYTSPSPRD